jgi:hypothetical protein
MAYHQLGQKDKAQALLTRIREARKRPRHAGNPSLQTFLGEAEALIEGKAPDPAK